MKTKRFAYPIAWSAALLALALVGTACSNSNNDNPAPSASSSASSSPSASPESSPSESPAEEAGASAPTELSATGKYVGMADGHSIEIDTDGGPVTYQISQEISDQVSSWEEGKPVKYVYVEEDLDVDGQTVKQTTIVSIEEE